MGLFDRFSTVVRADAHGVVDALEDRRLMLKQCLRDAEAELDRKRASLATLREELSRVQKGIVSASQQREDSDRSVALALEEGEEELARFATRRFLTAVRLLDTLSKRKEQLEEEIQSAQTVLAQQQQELEQLRERILEAIRHGDERWDTASVADAVTEQDVSLELLRRRAGGET